MEPGTQDDRVDGAPAGSMMGRIADIRRRMASAASGAGRNPDGVRLLLASKTIPPSTIIEALHGGCRLIGENRVQEVLAKAPALRAEPHETHFIGHLQRNKINQLLPYVSCVQTVDSADLARRLNESLARETTGGVDGRRIEVMIQVNVSGEESKYGIGFDAAPALLAEIAALPRLLVIGYMTVGLNSADRAAVRAGYAELAAFRDKALAAGFEGAQGATGLSMGMSGDLELAIAEGSTMVRIGSAVFGPRATT